jgi:hypothetical protein
MRSSGGSVVGFTNTFHLRGVDPDKILAKYLAGDYAEMSIPGQKVVMAKNITRTNHDVGNSTESEFYRFEDKSWCTKTILTLDHDQYKSCQTAKIGKLDQYTCSYCRRIRQNERPLCIPVKMDYDRLNDKYIFYGVGRYCTFRCMYTMCKLNSSITRIYRDPMYKDSIQMVQILYRLMNPDGEPLKSLPDWELHVCSGGPLTDDEFFSTSCQYVKLPNVIMLPAKRQYIRSTIV